ncbi:hypothetical protein [Sulfuriflexus mobilis]|uniref:hypothetical protein n=1 Tax=Sulfuriflexus mobilis TaxID=1811807 RepID=UPI000F838D39|nr:hypothetical protein [Sulfuriflexus mobilis]
MIYITGTVFMACALFALYLPLRGWQVWQGRFRYWVVLPLLPPLALTVYLVRGMLQTPPVHRVEPGLLVITVLASLILSAVLWLIHERRKGN